MSDSAFADATMKPFMKPLLKEEKKLKMNELHDLFVEYERELTAYALRKIGSLDEARDVVQEAFLKACSRVQTHAVSAANPKAWLYQIVNNLCIICISQRRVRENHVTVAMNRTRRFEHSVEHIFLGKALLADIENFVANDFSHRERRVFHLSAHRGQKQVDIAQTLGLGKPAISKILKRIDEKLRSKFSETVGNF